MRQQAGGQQHLVARPVGQRLDLAAVVGHRRPLAAQRLLAQRQRRRGGPRHAGVPRPPPVPAPDRELEQLSAERLAHSRGDLPGRLVVGVAVTTPRHGHHAARTRAIQQRVQEGLQLRGVLAEPAVREPEQVQAGARREPLHRLGDLAGPLGGERGRRDGRRGRMRGLAGRGDHDVDAHAALVGHHQQAAGAERLVVRVRGDDDQSGRRAGEQLVEVESWQRTLVQPGAPLGLAGARSAVVEGHHCCSSSLSSSRPRLARSRSAWCWRR